VGAVHGETYGKRDAPFLGRLLERHEKETRANASRRDSARRVHGLTKVEHEPNGDGSARSLTRIADIIHERRGITADTALRFGRYFQNTPVFWMNLQARFDLEVAEDRIAVKVARDVRPLEVATN